MHSTFCTYVYIVFLSISCTHQVLALISHFLLMPRSYFQLVEVESQWVTLSGKPVTQLYTFEMELSSATVLFQLLL